MHQSGEEKLKEKVKSRRNNKNVVKIKFLATHVI
jgi:hypothetical protein